jgi:hypothetical protein
MPREECGEISYEENRAKPPCKLKLRVGKYLYCPEHGGMRTYTSTRRSKPTRTEDHAP